MVYFTCGACGEQIKKPQVEKHYTQKCRRCEVLTCIDCLKDFYGDEYMSHNQCMSEEQRYSKTGRNGWDPNQGQGNKGDKKQQEWNEKLRELLQSKSHLSPSVRNIVNTILNHDNIPRKRPKFINFIKNIMKWAKPADIEETWDLLSQALVKEPEVQKATETEPMETEIKKPKEDENEIKSKKKKKSKSKEEVLAPTTQEVTTSKKDKKRKKKGKENEIVEKEEEIKSEPKQQQIKQKKGKKRKADQHTNKDNTNDESLMEVDNEEPASKKAKFDWDDIIGQVLAKKGNQMKLKKLKKKCVSEYFVQNPSCHQSSDQIAAKFDKKINKRQKYKIVGEDVMLNTRDKVVLDDQKSEANNEGVQKEDTKSSPPSEPPKVEQNGAKMSWNAWEAASLGNDSQTDKFRRLMGIKTDKKPHELADVNARKRAQGKIFRDLEKGFEAAQDTHFRSKGMGLGYS